MEESVCGATVPKEPFEQKTLDPFVPESESEFVEYAELINRKLRSFEKDHHYVAFLKAMNELSLDALSAADAEEVASSVSLIAQKKREQNTDTHKKMQLHRDGSVFNRLSAKDVLRCRLVCRRWRDITLSPCFIAKHAERAPEVLIFHAETHLRSSIFFVFGESKNKPNKEVESSRLRNFMRRESRECGFVFSYSNSVQGCNGLLLGKRIQGWLIPICNPFTGDELFVSTPNFETVVFGFFFHPNIGDYRVLCLDGREDGFVFTIPRAPNPFDTHITANRTLHWKALPETRSGWPPRCCNEFIITFDIGTEEFALRSHPGEIGCSDEMHKKMHLMEGQGDTLLCTHMVVGGL